MNPGTVVIDDKWQAENRLLAAEKYASVYSFDMNIREIGLTVLRSPIFAHHMPVVPQADFDYTYMDQEIQKFSYLLLPHGGSWEEAGTVQHSAELNMPPAIHPATFHAGSLPAQMSFLAVELRNVVAVALKKAEDSEDLILRLHETARSACEARVAFPRWGRTFQASLGPSEIRTFRIPADAAQPVIETNLIEL